jgi:peptidylprolyl isomerase
MPFEKGTLIYVNYTAKVKDTGEAIESTVADEAKKLNIYDSERTYAPRLVSVGEDWVLKGLDEEIAKMDTGERKTVELAPERGWGTRDPTLLRMIPLRKFGERADDLRVGDQVEVDNRLGVVRFLGSGRTQVDFNHRLAGKTLVYDVEIVSKVDGDQDKIRALIKRRFPGEVGEKMEFANEGGDVKIEVPEAAFMVEGLQVIKRGVANDVVHFIPTATAVRFEEVYAKREAPKPAVATAAASEATPPPAESSAAEAPQPSA